MELTDHKIFGNCFQNKKVIVTGHTGFKGSWLSLWLHQLGAIVTGISKDIPTTPSLFNELKLEEKITHHFADVCDSKLVDEIFKSANPDFIFHLAAQPIVSVSYQDPIDTFRTNVMGTATILEALRKLDHPCSAIMITSDKCYDNIEWVWGYRESDHLGGKDPYSASKGAAELIIKTYYHSYFSKPDSKVKLVSVRAGNVIGGGDWALNRIIPDCYRAWSQTKEVVIRNPASTRPWQHVLEPLSGYLRAGQILQENRIQITGEAFNFGPNSDQHCTVAEVLHAISEYWDFSNQLNRFSVEQNTNFHEAGLLKLNCDKALFYLQWIPALDFSGTVKFTGEWYNTFYNKLDVSIYDFSVGQIAEYQNRAIKNRIAWAQ